MQARNTDTFDLIGLTPSAGPLAPPPPSSNSLSVSTSSHRPSIAETRTLSAQELETSVVANSRIEGEGVMLAWQVDDKTFVSQPFSSFSLPPNTLTDQHRSFLCHPRTYLSKHASEVSCLFSSTTPRPSTRSSSDSSLLLHPLNPSQHLVLASIDSSATHRRWTTCPRESVSGCSRLLPLGREQKGCRRR